MPLIDSVCEDCDTVQELLVKHEQVDENNNVSECVCKTCGGSKLKKILSVAGGSFQLKGKWFKQGY